MHKDSSTLKYTCTIRSDCPSAYASTGEDSLAGDSYGVDRWHGDVHTTHHHVTLL